MPFRFATNPAVAARDVPINFLRFISVLPFMELPISASDCQRLPHHECSINISCEEVKYSEAISMSLRDLFEQKSTAQKLFNYPIMRDFGLQPLAWAVIDEKVDRSICTFGRIFHYQAGGSVIL